MQGDQFYLPIELKKENGDTLTRNEVKDIEFFVGKIRKTLLEGGAKFSEDTGTYDVYLTQQETFRLVDETPVQARIVFLNGMVTGIDVGNVCFNESISKVVLK